MSEQTQPQTRKEIEARIIAKAWKDDAYKQKLLSDPRAIIEQEFGVQLPQDLTIKVLEENPTSLYLVLPMSPLDMAQELSPEELEVLAGGLSTVLRVGGVVVGAIAAKPAVQTTGKALRTAAAAGFGLGYGQES